MTVEFLQSKTKDSVEFAKQIELTFSFFIFNEKTKVHSNNKTYSFIIRMNFSFFIENEKTKR